MRHPYYSSKFSCTDQIVQYRLYSMLQDDGTTLYFILVCKEQEQTLIHVGKNEPEARLLYEAIVGGSVTPCTLADIAQDREFCPVCMLLESKIAIDDVAVDAEMTDAVKREHAEEATLNL